MVVGHNGAVIYRKAYGERALEPRREAISIDTVYDATCRPCRHCPLRVLEPGRGARVETVDASARPAVALGDVHRLVGLPQEVVGLLVGPVGVEVGDRHWLRRSHRVLLRG